MVFEKGTAIKGISADEVLVLLDYPKYFDLVGQGLPDNKAILSRLEQERLIKSHGGRYNITNLGGILLAKNLDDFDSLGRKALRVIVYDGNNRINAISEQVGRKGYAAAFEGSISYINDKLPSSETIGQALRTEIKMYPELAIRELVANALIHQDFTIKGSGPMVEIFSDRVEVTNPGQALVESRRFLDSPPQSRNETLASFMRRINICEERGSGVDRVVEELEKNQLPAPKFFTEQNYTRTILYSRRPLTKMKKEDKIEACYWHACLRKESDELMTNTSLRERFGVEKKNQSVISRIISDALDAKLIKPYDPDSKSRKHVKYVPFWA